MQDTDVLTAEEFYKDGKTQKASEEPAICKMSSFRRCCCSPPSPAHLRDAIHHQSNWCLFDKAL